MRTCVRVCLCVRKTHRKHQQKPRNRLRNVVVVVVVGKSGVYTATFTQCRLDMPMYYYVFTVCQHSHSQPHVCNTSLLLPMYHCCASLSLSIVRLLLVLFIYFGFPFLSFASLPLHMPWLSFCSDMYSLCVCVCVLCRIVSCAVRCCSVCFWLKRNRGKLTNFTNRVRNVFLSSLTFLLVSMVQENEYLTKPTVCNVNNIMVGPCVYAFADLLRRMVSIFFDSTKNQLFEMFTHRYLYVHICSAYPNRK